MILVINGIPTLVETKAKSLYFIDGKNMVSGKGILA
jgi:hypothetical protein